MPDRFTALYPLETAKFQVVESMQMPGFPREMQPDLSNVNTMRDFYGERLLDEFAVTDGQVIDRLAFVNKLNPHGRYDMMILASDEEPKSSVGDLSVKTIQTLQFIAHSFLDFVSDPKQIETYNLQDGRFHFCFNYDRDTLDRESGMAEKRFHLHLNYWTGEELSRNEVKTLGELHDVAWKQRLLDPIAYVGSQVAYDACGGEVAGCPLLPHDPARDARLGLPAGLKIPFANWSVLASEQFPAVLKELHRTMFNTFEEIVRVFTGSAPTVQPWVRNTLRPKEQILAGLDALDYLSDDSRQGLEVLAHALRDISPRVMDYLKTHKSARIRHLSMGGLNYSLGLYTPQANQLQQPLVDGAPVYLVVQPKLFADMGGAGITYMGDQPIVRIKRGDGVFTSAQIDSRNQFQSAFLEHVLPRLQQLDHVMYQKGAFVK